jgi:hypothetical protein
VGFDPANRNGLGGSPTDALLLASDIAKAGFSAPETAHAVCVEVPPGSKEVEAFNERLCAGSGLPPIEKDCIRFGSLACGHTNQALRAIAAGVPSDCELLSDNGRMSARRLRDRDPQYAEAVDQGLRWKVLKHAVRQCPRALDIIQVRLASKRDPGRSVVRHRKCTVQ